MEKDRTLKLINKKYDEFVKENNLCLTKKENILLYSVMVEGALFGIDMAKDILNNTEKG